MKPKKSKKNKKQITIMLSTELLDKIEKRRQQLIEETSMEDISRNKIVAAIIAKHFK